MNLTRSHITLVLMALSLSLFAGHAHANVLMLCVGADGHMEVESGADGNCASIELNHGASDEDEHCGSCLDIPLDAGSDDDCYSYTSVAQQKVQKPSPSVISLTLQSSEFLRSIPIAQPKSLTQATQMLHCLRTVSLLV